MNELAESVGAVTAIGMGTVFVCLIMLYGMTHVLGLITARMAARAEPRSSAKDETETATGTGRMTEPAGPSRAALVAAMTLVLARHRASIARPADQNGVDPWKLSGRVRALRTY